MEMKKQGKKWVSVKFKNFVQLQRGFDLPEHSREKGAYPIVASTSIVDYHDEYKVKAPCITTGRSGALGEVLFINQNCWPLNTTLWVKDFKGNVPKFIYYKLKTLGLEKFNAGAGVPTLNRNHLDELNINIPLKAEDQLCIVSILSAYDDLIEVNGKHIKILEEMGQRLYSEWFIKLKLPGHEKSRMVESGTKYGLVPEGWEVVKIGEKFTTTLGGTPSRAVESYWLNGTIPWINSGKVNQLRIIDASEMITKEALEKSATKMMPRRTTLLAITGATLGQVSLTEIECCANQSVIGIYDPEGLFNEYLYFKIKQIIKNIIALAGGGAQQHINKDIVNSTEILIPDKKFVNLFLNKVKPVFDEIASLMFKNKILQGTRDLLIPQLVTGKRELK